MKPKEIKERFLEQVDPRNGIHLLFENITNLVFWVKDIHGIFVMGNQALAEKCGYACEEDIIGKTDFDIHPPQLGENYVKDDREVVRTKKGIFNRVELIVNENGTVNWHNTNKVPLFDKKGEVIGVAGITRKIDKSDSSVKPYQEMSDVIEFISKKYSEHLEIKQLAYIAGLSVSQFERKFKQYFHESPMKFVIKVRISAACKELIAANRTISNIAYITGFYDQSYFTKKFTSYMGMTPKEYRKKYFKGI